MATPYSNNDNTTNPGPPLLGGIHKAYIIFYSCVFIITIVAIALPSWKLQDVELPGSVHQKVSVGLWQLKLEVTQGSNATSSNTATINPGCQYVIDGTNHNLLTGSDCSYFQVTRACVLIKLICGFTSIVLAWTAIARQKMNWFRNSRLIILLGAICGIIGIALFKQIPDSDWLGNNNNAGGWTTGQGWTVFTVASALSLATSILYRCLFRGRRGRTAPSEGQ